MDRAVTALGDIQTEVKMDSEFVFYDILLNSCSHVSRYDRIRFSGSAEYMR